MIKLQPRFAADYLGGSVMINILKRIYAKYLYYTFYTNSTDNSTCS